MAQTFTKTFTKENYARMNELILKAILKNVIIQGDFNQPYTVQDLLHSFPISEVEKKQQALENKAIKLGNKSKWKTTESDELEKQQIEEVAEMLGLIAGYRYTLEDKAKLKAKMEANQETINALKEANKTPEQQQKDLEAENEALKKELEMFE